MLFATGICEQAEKKKISQASADKLWAIMTNWSPPQSPTVAMQRGAVMVATAELAKKCLLEKFDTKQSIKDTLPILLESKSVVIEPIVAGKNRLMPKFGHAMRPNTRRCKPHLWQKT